MSLSDPIGDALTAIRNANRVKKERVDIKNSKMVTNILKIMRSKKFIYDYRTIDDKKQGILRVYLKKTGESTRSITKIIRISRPGLRKYTKRDMIPTVLSGYGICILSTPQGVMAGDDAKKRGLGGEVICKIW